MAIDERNFRSAYYEKVGFTNVEEKKSLEILLKEKPLNLLKLKQFCLRFIVPGTYRNLVWKLLLEVIPVQESCRGFVMSQRHQEYSNLLHALDVMKVSPNKARDELFIAIWLLQRGKLQSTIKNEDWLKPLQQMAKSMILQFEQNDDVDIYWLLKTFNDAVSKFQIEMPKLIDATHNLLEKEDLKLFEHLNRIDALRNLPFEEWYSSCFANVLNDGFLSRIWDKIAAGCYKILVYSSTVMLITLKDQLLLCNNANEVLTIINKISGKLPEIIVTKSLKLWQQHGAPVTVYDKPKP